MTEAEQLEKIKTSLTITGDYMDGTLKGYMEDIKMYLMNAGVHSAVVNSSASVGVICRGVADLWLNDAKLSDYFKQRATQLSLYDTSKIISFCEGDYGHQIVILSEDVRQDDVYIFSMTGITKEVKDTKEISIVFSQGESENLPQGSYTWKLKRKRDGSVKTIIKDGICEVI